MIGSQRQAARLWARVVALVVDWTAALALLVALVGAGALGGLVEPVWASLCDVA